MSKGARPKAKYSYQYFCMGMFQIFTQPLALAIGKRPVYILSILGGACFPFWVTTVSSGPEWYGCNVWQGFLGSPLFVLPELSLADTYFYHERGAPMGIYVAATYGAPLFAPVVSGYIYTSLGWRAPPVCAGVGVFS